MSENILHVAVDRAGRTWCVLEREDGTFAVYYHPADTPARRQVIYDAADYWSEPPRILLKRAEDAELRAARLTGELVEAKEELAELRAEVRVLRSAARAAPTGDGEKEG